LSSASARQEPDSGERLLELLRVLARELHPQDARVASLGLEHSLERDFGLDSLARVELAARVEQAWNVRLPEEAFSEAETPRDLLRFIGSAPLAEAPVRAPAAAPARPPAAVDQAPASVQTLTEALDWHVARHPQRVHITLYGERDAPEEISYGALAEAARDFGAGLVARGVAQGERVAIMLPTSREFFVAFYGALRAGAIPVPLYPPARPAQLEQHFRRIAGIVANSGAGLFVTIEQAKVFAHVLQTHAGSLRHVATVGDVLGADGAAPAHRAAAGDTAFLQYTSGSTGRPKGVVLSHANLLANLRAMGAAARVSSADTFVSWLPLYHDMGLIGACLGSMLFAFPLVLMSPLAFLSRPARWLRRIQQHRGTLTSAPNFAYELCLSKLADSELEGLELGSLRLSFNGAEAVSADTVERFCERFARYGFRREAMTPVYGLAECCLGTTFPPLERGALIERIDRSHFLSHGVARLARDDDPLPLRVVACGRALPDHAVRVVDERGRGLGDREQGRVQFSGPSATRGYFENPEETAKLIDGAWRNTGDLGYLANGELFVTGRAKDVIIRGGHNIHPMELEDAADEVKGVRHGGVAVFAASDARTGTERLVVLAETRESKPEERARMIAEINRHAVDLIGMPADEVVLAPPRTVLKTSSGKIRRAACRELYERGALGARARPPWLQLALLGAEGAALRARRALRRAGEFLWGAWAVGSFFLVALPAWLLIAAMLNAARARAIARGAARLVFRLWGARLQVDGAERLAPDLKAIIVSNHASYLDGLLLTAALPPRIAFVAKRELAPQLFAGTLLRRLGSLFVERVDVARGVEDHRAIEDRARAGVAPLVFPEGTLRREPGLLPFRTGAFVSAVAAGAAVVPVVLRGTRSMLPDGIWYPRPGRLEVLVCAPILPDGTDWHAAIRLRGRVREAILARAGEPDAAGARVDFRVLAGAPPRGGG
jgi:1-acyl-sn-glycerol-3-phosphate acyltransferase